MKKDKLFAPFLTLLVTAITLLLCLYWGYKLSKIVWILLIVVIVFYIIGSYIQTKVNKFIAANEEAEREREEQEGAVIEKEANPDDPDAEAEDDEESFTLPKLTGAIPDVPGEANAPREEFRTREE